MNKDMLLDAMGKIDDKYIISAQRRLDGSCRARRIPHRVPFAAAVIVVLLMSTFTMAMAFNEDFRNAVFRFFRVSTPDKVLPMEEDPDSSEPIEIIGETSIGDTINVLYVRLNEIYDCGRGGIISLYDFETRERAYAYTVTDKGLNRLEPRRASLEYEWKDTLYRISFDWYEDGGTIYADAHSFDPETSAEWSVHAVDGTSSLVGITLSYGSQLTYEACPLLYDPGTQTLYDITARCEALRSQTITDISFSEDASGLLAECGYLDRKVYYYDIAASVLYSLEEWADMPVTAAWFIDKDTVCCISETDGGMTCRTIALSAGECTEIFSSLPELEAGAGSGIRFTGGRYALLVKENRDTYVYDLKTGEYAPIDGFQFPSEDVFTAGNEDGSKILFARNDPGSAGSGLAVSEIGILDLEKRVFTLFTREGYEIRQEETLGWFDRDRVMIQAAADDYRGGYLYLFTIK